MNPPHPPLAAVLPRWMAERLHLASRVPNTPGDPRARLKAVEEVTRHLKQSHPQFFKPEQP